MPRRHLGASGVTAAKPMLPTTSCTQAWTVDSQKVVTLKEELKICLIVLFWFSLPSSVAWLWCLAAPGTDFWITTDKVIIGYWSQPSGAGWCCLLIPQEESLVDLDIYGVRGRGCVQAEKGRSAPINVPAKLWIWKCSVIQGLNNSARPWCLMPLLFHRPRQSKLPSQHLGLESNERHQRRSVPAGWRVTGAVWCDEVGGWGNTLETSDLACRLTYAQASMADLQQRPPICYYNHIWTFIIAL